MNKELPSNNNKSEEVDLIVFFNLIGNAINKVLAFIASIFKGIYAVFISIAKGIFLNIKLIAGVAIIAVVLGTVMDKMKDKVYYSEMFVIPHFDAKYELINNVNYYNSLIKMKDTEELSKQFDINEEESKSLINFEIEIGPESQNEQLTDFNGFLKTLDSTTKSKISFEDYLENRNLYNSKIYLLRAKSTNYKIFKKLETGLSKSINNDFSDSAKKERDSVLKLEKENLELSLIGIQNLKEAYLKVLEKESDKNIVSSNLANTLGFQVEKTKTKEDELLLKEIETLNKLNDIKKELVLNDTLYDRVASFKEKGLLENVWYKNFKIITPILALLILGLFINLFKFYKYTLNFK